MTEHKQTIIDLFRNLIKNKEVNLANYNKNYCGKEGYWLEKKLGITHNSISEADLFGYEIKKSCDKITFVDMSATEYLFSKNKKLISKINNWSDNENIISRKDFIHYFGTEKNKIFSWSGLCVPKYGQYNSSGQILLIQDNCIQIFYSFNEDKRENKDSLPEFLKKETVLIAIWTEEKIKNHIDKKFNENGFILFKKSKLVYTSICFGKSFNFQYFIENIKLCNIFFDSGMKETNTRNYSIFRASKSFWSNLIYEEFF